VKGLFGWLTAIFSRDALRELSKLEEAYTSMKSTLRITEDENASLKKDIETMKEENANLTEENDLIRQKLKNYELISDAINAKEEKNSDLVEFRSIIDNDFTHELAGAIRGTNGAEALLEIERVYADMKLIAQCQNLHSKSIGAIGGGFSSGKSSFINSFLEGEESQIRLAEGTNPVTVIPSYVICDKTSLVEGISFNGNRFGIDTEMYSNLSHEYIKRSFSFELSRIIFYTTVQTPMKEEYFGNLCLIDTPGYNSPNSGNTRHDFETAKKYIKDVSFLIWLVGLDSTGTFPKSDITFLEELNLFGKQEKLPLYIVANKAGQKKPDDIEDILDTFADQLDDYDISYMGISAYDSKQKKLYAHRKKDIFEFLTEYNKPSKKYVQLKGILHNVFKEYVEKLDERYKRHSKVRRAIQSIELDVLENIEIDSDAQDKIQDGLGGLKSDDSLITEEKYKKDLAAITKTRDGFMKCLKNFCISMEMECTDPKFCTECGEPFEGSGDICPQCVKKVCGKCGALGKASNTFCENCGAKLT